jgi:hypothetical protein
MSLDWRVSFDPGTGFVTLPDVQDISIFRGRRRSIDPFQAESCTIVSRDPDGWTSTPKVGDEILVYIYGQYIGVSPSNVYNIMFQGYIRDVRINYGKVPAQDVVTIECEGLQAALGRAQLTNYSEISRDVGLQYSDVISEVGLPAGWASAGTSSIGSAVTNLNANALEYVNALVRTEQGTLRSTAELSTLDVGTLDFIGRNTANIGAADPPLFDDGTGTPPYPNFAFEYDQLEFRSQAEDYFNEVVVQPVGLAAQIADTAETPIISYKLDSYDANTSQALQLANYVLQKFQDRDSVIKSISFQLDNQANLADAIKYLWSSWNQTTEIAFRGDLYNVFIEGYTISARPDGLTRATLFTSAGDTNAYLRLDDAFYGRLDFNRLSF